jgi:hypothetical protein
MLFSLLPLNFAAAGDLSSDSMIPNCVSKTAVAIVGTLSFSIAAMLFRNFLQKAGEMDSVSDEEEASEYGLREAVLMAEEGDETDLPRKVPDSEEWEIEELEDDYQ